MGDRVIGTMNRQLRGLARMPLNRRVGPKAGIREGRKGKVRPVGIKGAQGKLGALAGRGRRNKSGKREKSA